MDGESTCWQENVYSTEVTQERGIEEGWKRDEGHATGKCSKCDAPSPLINDLVMGYM